jgi:hypothetical protein
MAQVGNIVIKERSDRLWEMLVYDQIGRHERTFYVFDKTDATKLVTQRYHNWPVAIYRER